MATLAPDPVVVPSDGEHDGNAENDAGACALTVRSRQQPPLGTKQRTKSCCTQNVRGGARVHNRTQRVGTLTCVHVLSKKHLEGQQGLWMPCSWFEMALDVVHSAVEEVASIFLP